jgi:hypothetical protein
VIILGTATIFCASNLLTLVDDDFSKEGGPLMVAALAFYSHRYSSLLRRQKNAKKIFIFLSYVVLAIVCTTENSKYVSVNVICTLIIAIVLLFEHENR